ncbi:MAG TPA: high-potential iron-sulfur protein [Bradyrhizobium sp.]|nr:high-potential iron-sulfur protein [Bradyrhizobium sp.]
MTDENKFSRRRVLSVVVGAAGAATGAAIIGTPRPAYAKVPQKTVKYQDTPKGDQTCENCALFEAPSSCKTVDGAVSPQGWCIVYARKPA